MPLDRTTQQLFFSSRSLAFAVACGWTLTHPAFAQDAPPTDSAPTESPSTPTEPDETPGDPTGSADDTSPSPPTAPPEPPQEPEAPQSKERLPALQSTGTVAYPQEALTTGQQAQVLLELLISDQGTVLESRVVESGGEAFDAAILAATPQFQFLPALDSAGQPTAARILYRYQFTLEAVPVLSVEGRVVAAGTRVPIPDVRLELTQAEHPSAAAVANQDGTFQLYDLAPGPWQLTATRDGFKPELLELSIEEKQVSNVVLYLVQDRPWLTDESDDTIEVTGQRVQPEITERVLSADEIRYLPGTNGDVVRAIQNLPGIARPPLNIGQLIIRGTAPENSAYFIDGMGIPNVFHFSGLSTVINGDSIERVSFLPGNFGPRYGRALGGVVDIRTSSRLPERSNGYVSVDLFQTTAFVEQKIGDNNALTVSGRRSYVDVILNPILNGMGTVRVQAPRYYDVQTRWLHTSPKVGTLDLFLLASDDRFRFVGEPEEGEETGTVEAGLTTTFQKARLLWRRELGGGWRMETAAIFGPENQTFVFGGTGQAYEKRLAAGLRQEFYRGVPQGKLLGWRFGLDFQGGQERFLYDVPVDSGVPGEGAIDAPEQGKAFFFMPAAYAESTVRLGPVDLTPGLRVDGMLLDSKYSAFSLDPRFSITWDVLLGTTLKSSVGRYSQFPTARQVLDTADKPSPLGPTSSLQVSLGLEQQFSTALSMEVTGFVNQLSRLVVGREDAFRFYAGPPPIGPFDIDSYANEGKGTIAGMELLGRFQSERLVALVSATFSRSTRVDRPKSERELFTYDQPIVVNALGSYKLPKRWRVGARVRASVGNPYTPVVNRIYNLNDRGFIPVYGERDSARLPPYWSLDLRIDKDYVFRKWTLTTYLDLQNATNNQNPELMSWTFDYEKEDPVLSIPITPAFGLRGEW